MCHSFCVFCYILSMKEAGKRKAEEYRKGRGKGRKKRKEKRRRRPPRRVDLLHLRSKCGVSINS